jgi:hypothetical protein
MQGSQAQVWQACALAAFIEQDNFIAEDSRCTAHQCACSKGVVTDLTMCLLCTCPVLARRGAHL